MPLSPYQPPPPPPPAGAPPPRSWPPPKSLVLCAFLSLQVEHCLIPTGMCILLYIPRSLINAPCGYGLSCAGTPSHTRVTRRQQCCRPAAGTSHRRSRQPAHMSESLWRPAIRTLPALYQLPAKRQKGQLHEEEGWPRHWQRAHCDSGKDTAEDSEPGAGPEPACSQASTVTIT